MPFSKKTYETKTESITIDFDDVYRSILKPGIQMSGNADGLPFFPTRADEGFYSGNIDQIMYKRLASSRICLADVTFQNVNVLLEIGTRYKANESGTLIVRQDAKSIPFDMSHMRVFSYDASDVPAARDTIARLLDESARAAVVDSPVRAAIAATPVPSSSAVPGAPAAIAAGSEAVVTALMHEAELALARGAENVALDRYEDVLKRMDDPEVRVRAAALAVRLGRYPDAVRHADAALRIDATNGAAHREKGIALERAQHGTGIASLKKAVDLSPNDYDAWSSLGGALRRSGDLASARQAYEHAVQLSNGDPYPLLNALILKQQAGIAPSALDQVMLRKAERIRRADVDTQPPRDTPWSFFDLSVIQLYLGRGTDAQATLLDGAGFATPAQLASHRNAIAPMASTSADAGWKAAVTFLDELIAEAPKPKP
jgi:tetratricopeptide (TPR) repeat protein